MLRAWEGSSAIGNVLPHTSWQGSDPQLSSTGSSSGYKMELKFGKSCEGSQGSTEGSRTRPMWKGKVKTDD